MEKSQEYCRMALKIISKNKLIPTPEIYTVLYEYCSGYSQQLTEDINRLMVENKMNNETILSIYEKFFQITNKHKITEIIDSLKKVVKELITSFSQVDLSQSDSEKKLYKIRQNLENAKTTEDIEQIINSILHEMNSFKNAGKLLNLKLKNSENIFIKLNKKIEKLKTASMEDTLTGVLNRRGFEEEFRKIIENDEIMDIAMIFGDIDNFKAINDNYSHLVGDEVLKIVADTLMKNTKGKDIVARFGGEEFIILVTNTSFKNVVHLAESLRKSISEKKLIIKRTKETLKPVTLSFGVAKYIKGEALDDLIERADKAMYYSKTHGKNRVTTEYQLNDQNITKIC